MGTKEPTKIDQLNQQIQNHPRFKKIPVELMASLKENPITRDTLAELMSKFAQTSKKSKELGFEVLNEINKFRIRESVPILKGALQAVMFRNDKVQDGEYCIIRTENENEYQLLIKRMQGKGEIDLRGRIKVTEQGYEVHYSQKKRGMTENIDEAIKSLGATTNPKPKNWDESMTIALEKQKIPIEPGLDQWGRPIQSKQTEKPTIVGWAHVETKREGKISEPPASLTNKTPPRSKSPK